MTVASVLRDFNAESMNCYKYDKHHTKELKDALASHFGLQQIVNEPTHILVQSSFCIDLTFTSSQSLVMESRVHPYLHLNCLHQTVYVKFDSKIHYPSSTI